MNLASEIISKKESKRETVMETKRKLKIKVDQFGLETARKEIMIKNE